MLVIRRRPGETLVIGEDVEIQVLSSSASQVKLGIRAPRSVNVVRQEIRMVGQQNQASAERRSERAVRNLLNALKNPPSKPISPA